MDIRHLRGRRSGLRAACLQKIRALPSLTYTLLMPQSEIIFSIQEAPEGGYQARALGHSIFTEADSLEELKTMIRDAVGCHFDGADKPRVIRLHMVKDEVIPA